eukprot:jgi/Tetstr1/466337/TSEL_010867.t1
MLVENLGYVVACTAVLAGLTFRHGRPLLYGSVAATLLTGLKVYVVPEDPNMPAGQQSTVTGNKASQVRNRISQQVRNRKKMTSTEKEDAQFKELQDSLGGAGFLRVAPLPRSVAEATRFFKEWDTLVYFFLILCTNVALGELGAALGLRTNTFIMPIAAMAALCTVHALAKTEYMAKDIIPQSVRWATLLIGVLNFGLALVLLLFAPANVIDFSVIAASKESMPSLVSYLRAKKPGIEIADGPAVDPFWASIVLAGAAGLTGALTFSAAQRWARVYFKAVSPPPSWGNEYMRFGFLAKLCMHLQLVFPLAVVIFWVKPMVEMWGVPDGTLELLQPAALVTTGLLGFLTLRPLMQSYLNLSLQYWYELKHGGKPSDQAALTHGRSTAMLIRVKVEYNQMLLIKVAIQLLSQGILCICYGVLLFCGTVELKAADDVRIVSVSFWRAMAGFLAWWTCASWFVYVTLGLLMHRIGMITS